MNDMILSVFLGQLFLALFFILCFAAVVTVKIVVLYFKREKEPDAPPAPPAKKPRKKPQRAPQIRSIEIDPDSVDKIYVKKAS